MKQVKNCSSTPHAAQQLCRVGLVDDDGVAAGTRQLVPAAAEAALCACLDRNLLYQPAQAENIVSQQSLHWTHNSRAGCCK